MKKELILITTYCPTTEKKETLINLLKSIQKFRDEYDILVASHTPLDKFIFEYFDYYYYDKNNELLSDIEYLQNGWFSPKDNYVIWSSYITKGNTMKAIWDMLIPSLSIAKNLNYVKVHLIEYDSIVMDDKEFKDNSKLLNEYDYIIYSGQTTHKLIGAFQSFNLDGIIDEWKSSNINYYDFFVEKYPKVPENILFNLISEQRKFLCKNKEILKENGVFINKISGNVEDWNVPYYEKSENSLKFLSRNVTSSDYHIKLIINDRFIDVGVIKPKHWKIIDLVYDFDNAELLTVFKDDVKILKIDFRDSRFRSQFKHYNSVLDNTSLLKK